MVAEYRQPPPAQATDRPRGRNERDTVANLHPHMSQGNHARAALAEEQQQYDPHALPGPSKKHVPCLLFAKHGHCPRGALCWFAHGPEEMQAGLQRIRTKMTQEIGPNGRRVCLYFKSGRCVRGAACPFYHAPQPESILDHQASHRNEASSFGSQPGSPKGEPAGAHVAGTEGHNRPQPGAKPPRASPDSTLRGLEEDASAGASRSESPQTGSGSRSHEGLPSSSRNQMPHADQDSEIHGDVGDWDQKDDSSATSGVHAAGPPLDAWSTAIENAVIGAAAASQAAAAQPGSMQNGIPQPSQPGDAWSKAIRDALDSAGALLRCPLTKEVFRNPVIAKDGRTFERAALLSWWSSHETFPYSRNIAYDRSLVPNASLRAAITALYGIVPVRPQPLGLRT
ncbi:hypothetical protein WJX84_011343 [Apatococcus fuscideae]|uniref:C3H1-type domain-containing protein n=1 Tax=Apatococcus fuscideae TaxID=2026836 RepID=A0AAW1TFS5_9CHLO